MREAVVIRKSSGTALVEIMRLERPQARDDMQIWGGLGEPFAEIARIQRSDVK